MNNSINEPCQNLDDEFSPFEKRLRDRSLGPGPQQCGELLYKCGYATGVAETQNKLGRATLRWRAIGMAASVLACVSLAINFRSFEPNKSSQTAVEQPRDPVQAQAGMESQARSSDAWFAQLTHERRTDRQDRHTLRASGTMQDIANVKEPLDELAPIVPSDHEFTPRPCDFPMFL